jgi:CDP-glycerol glycerophosphotransferase (TagB/SpsB family)
MNKPEVFFQFDEEKYRQKHYKEGYFDYREDGFGEVVKKEAELLKELENIMDNGAKINEKYRKRAEDFFTLRDSENCKRTYEAIVNLE